MSYTPVGWANDTTHPLSQANMKTLDAGIVRLAPIEVVTLAAATATITFSSVPSGFDRLLLRGYGGSTATSPLGGVLAHFRFNSDAGTNYWVHRTSYLGTSAPATVGSISGFGQLGYVVATGIAGASDRAGSIEAVIEAYSDTGWKTTVRSRSEQKAGSAIDNWRRALTDTSWESTAAVTQIDLTVSDGSWKAGSTFALYGLD